MAKWEYYLYYLDSLIMALTQKLIVEAYGYLFMLSSF